MMKIKHVSALGLFGLVAAGAAFGAPDTIPFAGVAVGTNSFQIAGSTALDNQVKAALLLAAPNGTGAGSFCQSGTTSVYTDAPSTAPAPNLKKAHNTLVTCNAAVAIGSVAAGHQIAVDKESNGGSNEGTANVANGPALAFLDATVAPAGCAAVIHVAAGAIYRDQQPFDEYDGCTGAFVNIVPTIGVADEDPSVFNLGPQAVNAATIAKLNTAALFQNQFAIALSLHEYRALQALQGLGATDTLANMPSLTSAQIASVFGGINGTWDQVVQGLPATPVFLCRRGQSSGTNVSADIYFLHNRCSGGHQVMNPATTTVAHCGGLGVGPSQTVENVGCKWAAVNLADAVFAGSAGGDVDSCLHAHDVNGDSALGVLGATQTFDDLNGAGGAPAVGAHQWRYVGIDGKKPTLISMSNGTYDYAYDNVLNTLKTLTGNPAALAGILTTTFQSVTALEDIVVTQIGDANYQTGGMLDAAIGTRNTLPTTAAMITGTGGTPTSAVTLQPQGTVDNCQAPLTFGPAYGKEQL